MEGMRDIARSYYERASVAEKWSMKKDFKKIDVNGCLDFEEYLCHHYMLSKVGLMRRCNGCKELLGGAYFSCLLCMGRGDNTYDLCCSCYRRGAADSSHEHSSDNMMDHHSLLRRFRERTAAEKSQYKKDFEELGVIAKAHYEAGSPQVQALAKELFQSMDSDSDGRVDLSEFLAFMSQQGYSHMKTPYFFNAFDVDGNGTLDFSEMMTLYYVIRSGRPFCDGCRRFIPGIFFSCVHCFKFNPKTSFYLCLDCYRSASCHHNHDGRTHFLDNYTLLQAMRDPALAASGLNLNHQAWNRPTNVIVQHSVTYNNMFYTVPHDVQATQKTKLELINAKLQLALTAGNIANALCTIM